MTNATVCDIIEEKEYYKEFGDGYAIQRMGRIYSRQMVQQRS